MVEDDVDSVRYYDRNAERFAADTGGLDLSALQGRFLQHLPAGGRILDAGCGVGRDALAFALRGYSVVAFDASVEMVRIAKGRLAGRAEVLQMRFEDVAWCAAFDGIWACASLLHVPSVELSAVARRLAAALRMGGAIYMSFKQGSRERITDARRFTDQTEETLRSTLEGTGLTIVEAWTTTDVREGRSGEFWLNAIAKRNNEQPS